jgi:hypothetical protein
LKLRILTDVDIPTLEVWSKEVAEAFVTMATAGVEAIGKICPFPQFTYKIVAGAPENTADPPQAGQHSFEYGVTGDKKVGTILRTRRKARP